MNSTLPTRAYALGLGYGSLWLVSATTAFAILDTINITTSLLSLIITLLAVAIIGGSLLFLCTRLIRTAYTLPKGEQAPISRTRRRLFLLLILAEIVGWSVTNGLLGTHGQAVWIVPIDLLIIAAHFLPLAFVFKVPAYLIMGTLWIVLIILCMILLPSTLIIGHVSAWTTIPSIGCILITWLTVLYLLTTIGKGVHLRVQSSL